MKKLFILFTLCLLLAFAASVSAETESFDMHMYAVEFNDIAGTFAARATSTTAWQILDSDRKPLTAALYTDVTIRKGFYIVQVAPSGDDDLHIKGLLDGQGNEIIPAQYFAIDVIDSRIQVGIRVEEGNQNLKDYTVYGGGTTRYYKVLEADIYLDGVKIGTLDRMFYTDMIQLFGDYLRIRRRSGDYVWYNLQLEKSPYTCKDCLSEYDRVRQNGIYSYIHNGTGQKAFDPGCTLTPDQVQNPYFFEGYTLLDLQGNMVFQTQRKYESVVPFADGLLLAKEWLSDKSDYTYGMLDLDGNVFIPTIYERIGKWYYEIEGFLFGYTSALKDGKFGFLDSQGNETCDFTYAEDAVDSYGTFGVVKNDDGTVTVLSAAIGELPEHYAGASAFHNSGAMVILVGKSDGSVCLIDLYGNEIYTFTQEEVEGLDDFTVTPDGTVGFGKFSSKSGLSGTQRIFHFDLPGQSALEPVDSVQQIFGSNDFICTPQADGTIVCMPVSGN